MEFPNALKDAAKIVESEKGMHDNKLYWTGLIAEAMLDFNEKCEAYLKHHGLLITNHLNQKVA